MYKETFLGNNLCDNWSYPPHLTYSVSLFKRIFYLGFQDVQHFSGYIFTNLLLYMCLIISITALNTQKPWVPSNAKSPNARTTSPPCCPQHSSLPRLPYTDPGREGEIYEWEIQLCSRWNVNSILFQTGSYRTNFVTCWWSLTINLDPSCLCKSLWPRTKDFRNKSLQVVHGVVPFKPSPNNAVIKGTFSKMLGDLNCLIPS